EDGRGRAEEFSTRECLLGGLAPHGEALFLQRHQAFGILGRNPRCAVVEPHTLLTITHSRLLRFGHRAQTIPSTGTSISEDDPRIKSVQHAFRAAFLSDLSYILSLYNTRHINGVRFTISNIHLP